MTISNFSICLVRLIEYLIKYFADSAGKKGGEFYTPRTVVKLLVNILDPAQDAEICDPAVGSGGMLIESFNHVESKYGSARKLTLYGQEKNGTTWGLCKLNMLFHDILDAQIENGNSQRAKAYRRRGAETVRHCHCQSALFAELFRRHHEA
jgi:type I restriction enzyme M protein